MKCKQCGHDLKERGNFCPACGNKLELEIKENSTTSSNDSCHPNMEATTTPAKNKLLGFRSGKWYKKLIASAYLIVVTVFLILAILGSNEFVTSLQDQIILKISNILLFSWLTMIFPYFIISNVFGLRHKLPLYKNPNKLVQVLGIFLTSIIVLTSYQIVDSFHTQEYKEATQSRSEQESDQVSQESEVEIQVEPDDQAQEEIQGPAQGESSEDIDVEISMQLQEEQNEVVAEMINNDLLYTDFVIACGTIGLDITKIKNFEQIADWAGGTRYDFTYEQLSMHLYNNENTVASVKVGNFPDVYKENYEPYLINDYIPNESIIAELKVKAEDLVKNQLNYPSAASFSIFDFAYGRVRDEYILQNTFTAKNAFGVKDEMSYDVRFYVTDESYTAVYLAVGGSVVFDKRTEDSEREQISGFVDYTISDIPDDVPLLTAEELYNNSAQYDQREIVVKGEILQVVSYSDMTGYYLFGVRGNGLVCWVYTTQEYDVGDTVEFYGTVYSGSNVEISDCIVVE